MNTITTKRNLRAEKRDALEARRQAHHCALETLRAPHCSLSGIQLWRKLSALERLAHAGAEAYCNGETLRLYWPLFGPREYNFRNDGETAWKQLAEVATDCVRNVFGCVPLGFYVNGDARGHALKIHSEVVPLPSGMETDWGRNGILAAEITQ